jgi:hypothetical protein
MILIRTPMTITGKSTIIVIRMSTTVVNKITSPD